MSVLATKSTSWFMVLLMTILSWFGISIDKSYEAYIVPADSTLTVVSEDGEKTVYTAGQRLAKDADLAVGSTFTDGEYKYILSSVATTEYTTKQWGATVIDKTKTNYSDLINSTQAVAYHKYSDEEEFYNYQGLFGYLVTSVNFNNCVNMIALPPNLFNRGCQLTSLTCSGCKNLTSVGEIPASIVSLNGAFVGCESLLAPPALSEDATSYPDMTNAFERCPNIVFPDGYVVNCISYSLVYSEQNNEWYLRDRFFNSNLVQGFLNQIKLRGYKYAGIAIALNGLKTSCAVLTDRQTAMVLSFDISNSDNSYWLVDVNGYSATEIDTIEKYWEAKDNVFCGYKVVFN